jgi:hypothetical protein
MFFKKEQKASPASKIARLSKMTTPEIISWMDVTIISLGQSFDSWRYKDGTKEEVSTCLNTLKAMWDELDERFSDKIDN